MPRKFYLIGHNPNSIEEVEQCLKAGANAIEPDVFFDGNEFYVMEIIPYISKIFPPKKGPLLKDYLSQLKTLLINNPTYKLALILWDTKDIDKYDINQLFDLVRQHFSSSFPQIAIGFTAGDKKFMPRFDQFHRVFDNECIGIDGSCDAEEAEQHFSNNSMQYTFASGTTVPLIPTTYHTYKDRIVKSLQFRDAPGNKFLKLVYVFTVNSSGSIRTYLRLNVDCLVTDKVDRVKAILKEPEFADKFELATPGYNPFMVVPVNPDNTTRPI